MRVSQEGKQISPAQKAINTVVKKNGRQLIPHNSTKNKTASKFSWYKYTNEFTGEEISLSLSQLLDLGRDFLKETQKNDDMVLLQSYWTLKGIPYFRVVDWCKTVPGFEAMFQVGKQIIGDRRERILRGDYNHLRGRQSVYVQEYHDYDMQKFEFMERFKQGLEQSGTLSLDQIQAVMQVCFPKTPKPEGWKDPRVEDPRERIETKREVEE